MKLAWIDLRGLDDPKAVAEEAVHVGVHGLLSDDPTLLNVLPPSVRRVGLAGFGTPESQFAELCDAADLVVRDHREIADWSATQVPGFETELGAYVVVDNHTSLETACASASRFGWTVIEFTDPTKIPLEIVLAAADKSEGHTITVVRDIEEAEIVLGVLERGSDGVVFAPRGIGDAGDLVRLTHADSPHMQLEELEVRRIVHVGLGDRVCVDTCSHFGEDEGILVGSYSYGMILACSETHPLPYMPTRPFRVNAGALHSYTVGPDNRTRYLSELRAGSELLAVRTNGETRRVVVGRAKMETRPMLQIDAKSSSGTAVNLLVQDDWHVRVLGPQAEVNNVTELRPGDRIAGSTLTEPRHVGYAVREFLLEQ
ncbi:MAG: 3-dehydroquinate synthase II family protein [Pseudonocardiaceae bacterium]|nr:3-dehydroquinate synthase II family protein [Pseudonocardiaceae bacterium]